MVNIMADSLIISLENVGTYQGEREFQLQPGVNLVKAPNSVGKTSFIRGLRLLTMDERDLKGKEHFMNLRTDPNSARARVSLSNGLSAEREFRRSQGNLNPVNGEPITDADPSPVCFITEENELISRLLSGESIKPYIERISDVKDYDTATEILDEIQRDLDRKHREYREDLIRLEEKQDQLEKLEERRSELEEELENLPEVDEEKRQENQEINQEIEDLEEDLEDLNGKIRAHRKEKNKYETRKENVETEIDILQDRADNIGEDRDKIDRKVDSVTEELKDVNERVKEFEDKTRRIQDQIQQTNNNFKLRQKHGEEKKCMACGQKLSLKQLKRHEDDLKDARDDFQDKLKEANRRREDLRDRKERLEGDRRNLKRIGKELEKHRSERDTVERKLNKEKEKLEKLEEERESLNDEIESLYDEIDDEIGKIHRERSDLRQKLEEVETNISTVEDNIAELEEETVKADEIVDKLDFLDEAIRSLKESRKERMTAVRDLFNEQIKEIYDDFGFDDFDDIEIRDDYTIHVRRDNKTWPLDALSTSERKTLGIVLLICGKQEYYPDFPFFVADEFITSYDPQRLEQLEDKFSEVADYVIITQLVDPNEADELQVEHV